MPTSPSCSNRTSSRPIGYVLIEQKGFADAADLRRWIECALATVATCHPGLRALKSGGATFCE